MVTLKYQERFKTEKGVFDDFTKRNLFELQSRDVFEEMIGPIKVGKESNVFLAKKGEKQIIVKIYRVQNCDFNRMYGYIRKDPRYEFLRKRRREIIFSWTQREYKNLIRAYEAKLNVPKPLACKENILVEEMIGFDNPALNLKDQFPKNPKKFFAEIIAQMALLYQKADLIHGDLSSFNILNFNEKPYFIDFSQATPTKTPNSEELLHRDLKNILHFFEKMKVKADLEQTFLKITQKP